MNAAEFTAALPEPHVILGLRLLPLSLGRYRLLKRFDCPFVCDEERELSGEDAIKELVFALVICGLPCQEFRDLLDNGGLASECKRFGKTMAKVVRKTKGFNLFDCIGDFKQYLEESTSTPWRILPKNGLQSESISHWSHNIEVVLRSKVGWSAEEIEEQPMQKALCDFFKYCEGEDAIRLMRHEDYEELMKGAEANAEALAGIMPGMEN